MIKFREFVKTKHFYCFSITFILLMLQFGNGIFCDEGDVITGSWLVSKGWVIYRDIFAHHMPFPYYFMAIFNIMGFQDPVMLRVSFLLCLFVYFIILYIVFKDKINPLILCIFFVVYSLTMPYFWGQMVLADSFFAVSITTIFLIVLSNLQFDFSIKEQIVISIMTFIAFTSTLISVYPLMFFYIYYIVIRLNLYGKEKLHIVKNMKKDVVFAIIVLLPFLLWVAYMIFTKSFSAFIESGIKFNTEYYSKFTGDDTAVTLILKHIRNISVFILSPFESIMTMFNSSKFDMNLVFSIVTKISFMLFCSHLVLKKKYKLVGFIAGFIYLSYMRGDSFHGAPFYMPALFMFSYIMVEIINSIEFKNKITTWKVIYKITILIVFVVMIGNYVKVIFPLKNDFQKKEHEKIIELVTNENDRIWQAPVHIALYSTIKRLPADKYIFYLPWIDAVPGKNEEIIKDLTKNSPKAIYFESESNIWGYILKDYGSEVLSFIKDNYFNLPIVDKNIYFNNKYKDEILNTLKKNNYDTFNNGFSQEDRAGNLGNIINSTVTQEILCNEDNLVEIQLMVATFAKENQKGIINLKLCDEKNMIVAEKQYDLSTIKDNDILKFKFDSIKNSEDKKYKLEISTKSNVTDTALTFYASNSDSIKELNATINNVILGKDLFFITYYER